MPPPEEDAPEIAPGTDVFVPVQYRWSGNRSLQIAFGWTRPAGSDARWQLRPNRNSRPDRTALRLIHKRSAARFHRVGLRFSDDRVLLGADDRAGRGGTVVEWVRIGLVSDHRRGIGQRPRSCRRHDDRDAGAGSVCEIAEAAGDGAVLRQGLCRR